MASKESKERGGNGSLRGVLDKLVLHLPLSGRVPNLTSVFIKTPRTQHSSSGGLLGQPGCGLWGAAHVGPSGPAGPHDLRASFLRPSLTKQRAPMNNHPNAHSDCKNEREG